MAMRISGLVGAERRVRERLRRGVPEEERGEFRQEVEDLLRQVDDLLDMHGATGKELPGPSRAALAFLRGLDLDDLPAPSGDAAAPPAPVRVAGVEATSRHFSARLWRERDRLASDAAAREDFAADARSRAAAIREIARDSGSGPSGLPGRSRGHYAFLAWLGEPDRVGRAARAVRGVAAGFALPPGERLRVALTPTRGIFRYRRRGVLHELWVGAALAAAPESILGLVGRAVAGQPGPLTMLRGFWRSAEARELNEEIDGLVRPEGSARGRAHDLDASFDRVNRRFFDGGLDRCDLRWSADRTSRRFGTWDWSRGRLTVSATLDDPAVPAEVVDFVVYHELLHRVLGVEDRDGRALVHTKEFRRRERLFPGGREAQAFLRGGG